MYNWQDDSLLITQEAVHLREKMEELQLKLQKIVVRNK